VAIIIGRALFIGFFANGEIGPGAAGETSGADIHRSGMMGFTSVFGVVAPLGRAVQVDSIKTRVESAYGFSA